MTTLERATPLERFLLLNSTVDATGEYILGSIVTDAAQDRVGAGNVAGMIVEGLIGDMPFLPCTREEQYSAKQAIDSFFLRMGDVVSAGIVLVGTGLGFTATRFSQLNVVLAVLVGRAYAGRKAMPTVAVRTPARQALA